MAKPSALQVKLLSRANQTMPDGSPIPLVELSDEPWSGATLVTLVRRGWIEKRGKFFYITDAGRAALAKDGET